MEMLIQLNRAIDYIEEHLTEELDMKEIARIAYCSSYHFQRMFSFLAGITLSEYIRRRRLTMAAFDLQGGQRVIDVALEYGYQSPDAFSRAFSKFHGVKPSEVQSSTLGLKAYPKMTFQLTIRGGVEMQYRITEHDAFKILGYKKRVTLIPSGESDDIINFISEKEGDFDQLELLSNCDPKGVLHVCTNLSSSQEELDYYIGAATTHARVNDLAELMIPKLTWAIFSVEGSWPEVEEVWGRIYSEWFPTSDYQYQEGPEIMVSKQNHTEIWVPVSKRQKTWCKQ
ncbi:AraC family transcriptional regulator [Amphibacillus sediminis]|uniref:AraC family transcriptional regulator n=1 Tax=Amphibacillus sediminis TaxID=360185 RepID=UPI0008355B83|nr:AraC family transcriptional regulator [Amphibacillus sediminis]